MQARSHYQRGEDRNNGGIESLRKKQLKKAHLEQSSAKNEAAIQHTPVLKESSIRIDNTLSFMYSGETGTLVRFLAKQKITNLTIEEPSLEEIFMHYYQ